MLVNADVKQSTRIISGTAPTSGIAVMTSVIQHLAQIKCKVVCTTHFLEMFSLGLLQESNGGIKAVRMRIHAPESDEDDADADANADAGPARHPAHQRGLA